MNDYQKSRDWLGRTKSVQGIVYKQLIKTLFSACLQLFLSFLCSRVISKLMLQIVASLSDDPRGVEPLIMLLENIYSTGVTYDDCHIQSSYFYSTGHWAQLSQDGVPQPQRGNLNNLNTIAVRRQYSSIHSMMFAIG